MDVMAKRMGEVPDGENSQEQEFEHPYRYELHLDPDDYKNNVIDFAKLVHTETGIAEVLASHDD